MRRRGPPLLGPWFRLPWVCLPWSRIPSGLGDTLVWRPGTLSCVLPPEEGAPLVWELEGASSWEAFTTWLHPRDSFATGLFVEMPEEQGQPEFLSPHLSQLNKWRLRCQRWSPRDALLWSTKSLMCGQWTYLFAWTLPPHPELIRLLEILKEARRKVFFYSLQMVRHAVFRHDAARKGFHNTQDTLVLTIFRDPQCVRYTVFWGQAVVLYRHILRPPIPPEKARHPQLRAADTAPLEETETLRYVARKYPFLPPAVVRVFFERPEDDRAGDQILLEAYHHLPSPHQRWGRVVLNDAELRRRSPFFLQHFQTLWRRLSCAFLLLGPGWAALTVCQKVFDLLGIRQEIQELISGVHPPLPPSKDLEGLRLFWERFRQTTLEPLRHFADLKAHLPSPLPLLQVTWELKRTVPPFSSGCLTLLLPAPRKFSSTPLALSPLPTVSQGLLDQLQTRLAHQYGHCSVTYNGSTLSYRLPLPCGRPS